MNDEIILTVKLILFFCAACFYCWEDNHGGWRGQGQPHLIRRVLKSPSTNRCRTKNVNQVPQLNATPSENTAKKKANSPTPLFCEFGPLHCWNILYPNLKAFMGFLPLNINFDCISRGKSLAYEVFQTQVGEYSFCFAVLILALLLVKLSFNFYAFFQYFYAFPKMPRRRILN